MVPYRLAFPANQVDAIPGDRLRPIFQSAHVSLNQPGALTHSPGCNGSGDRTSSTSHPGDRGNIPLNLHAPTR
ncbi:hypothetical protein NDA01_19960 [Trichocoleus desertorum AS-A10]